MLVAVEGITNAGKTTLIKRILEKTQVSFQVYNKDNVVHRNISRITHWNENKGKFNSETELLLYSSLLAEKAKQCQESQSVFLVDRYALSIYSLFKSKYGFDGEFLDELIAFSTNSIIPDLTVFVDVSLEVILERTSESPLSRKDSGLQSFFYEMRETYLENISRYSKHVLIVDGTQSVDLLAEKVLGKINEIVAEC